MNNRKMKLSFILGLLITISAILIWIFTHNWTSLVPPLWQACLLFLGIALIFSRTIFTVLQKWIKNSSIEPTEPIIYPVMLADLLRFLGRGAKVNYLDRELITIDTLTRYRRLVITGDSGSGKTRTAIELVRQLILEGVISEDGIFVINPAFQYLYRAELKSAIQKAQSSHTVQLLFVDNLSGQISDLALELLSDILAACDPALVVTTARAEELWEPLHQWLEKENFYEIHLTKFTQEQMDRLMDLAGGAFGLQISPVASKVLTNNIEPSPGRLLVAVGRLANREPAYLTPDLILPYTVGNLSESFYAERALLTKNVSGSLFILEALAHFRTAHLPLYFHLITNFAKFLWKQSKQKPWYAIDPILQYFLRKACRTLYALDINLNDQIFECNQLSLDGISNPQSAFLELTAFTNHLCSKKMALIPKFLRETPQLAWIFFLIGGECQIKHELEKARDLFTAAIGLHPHSWFYTHRSIVLSELNQTDKAIADAVLAIKLDPNAAPAYTIRGNSHLIKNEINAAIEDFTKAIEIDPKDAQAWVNRGNAYFAVEDIEKAVEDFDMALKLIPGFPSAVLARAKAHNIRGQLDRAIADYDAAIVHNPEDPQLIYNRASAYDSVGDFSRAVAEYDKLVAINPKDAQAYYNRGKSHHMLGNLEQAVLDYEQAILANPKSAIAYRNRANALIRLNRLMEAKSDCREAERLEPNHPFTHARWGQYFAAREDYIGAIEKYELAAKLIGNPTHFNLDIGFCLLCSGNSTAGLTNIKERLKKGIKKEEALEALKDYEAQNLKHQAPGFQEAINLLREVSKQ
jgi:tetratricopeptide (TPR) repeat protein